MRAHSAQIRAMAPAAVVAGATMLLVGIAWLEFRTSFLEAHALSSVATTLWWHVTPGSSPTIVFPGPGPFDHSRGYREIPAFGRRLEAHGFRLIEQVRFSSGLALLARLGVPPPWREPAAAGLVIQGAGGDTLFDATPRADLFGSYDEVPPLVVETLLFLENRKLRDSGDRYLNPAMDWDRLAKATALYASHTIGLTSRVEGGSTLAVQLEKYRHSQMGLTKSARDKLGQIVSASLRAYRDGPDTRGKRREIVVDYLNTVPLAAVPAHGEIHGLGQGLRLWFGLEPNSVWRAIAHSGSGPKKARAYKHALALLYAVRAPSELLAGDRRELERRIDRYTHLLAAGGVIDERFARAVRRARLAAAPEPGNRESLDFALLKAPSLMRLELAGLLGTRDFYELDRLHLRAQSTLDLAIQDTAVRVFERLRDPEFVASHGLRGERLLATGDPGRVTYSMALYESAPQGNLLRAWVDDLDRPFDVNRSMKMELGSTAKLRTLAHYLEIVAEQHAELERLDRQALLARVSRARDPITNWAAKTMAGMPRMPLQDLLEASLERKYSASPWEVFFTDGGQQTYGNFDPADNRRILTVRQAVVHSTNLVFIRLMRDLVRYHQARLPYDPAVVANDASSPLRHTMLVEAAEEESRAILGRAHRQFGGMPDSVIVARLLGRAAGRPETQAALFFAWHPGADFPALVRWFEARRMTLTGETLQRLFFIYGNPRFTMLDYGYLLRRHPLELWCAGEVAGDPEIPMDSLLARSESVRALSSAWLLDGRHRAAQELRLRTRFEQDAFERMTPYWRRLGFPFERLVPSLATAIGTSCDRPAALAELMGIIVNDGVRRPEISLTRLYLAPDSPYHTLYQAPHAAGERLMDPVVARSLRRVLASVVAEGTARRLEGVFVGPDSTPVVVGGKTGSGDNRFDTFGRGGWVITSRAVSRTAAFTFYIGDRYFGVITASVVGPRSADYCFTSALPLEALRLIAPAIQHRLAPRPEPIGTFASKGAPSKPRPGPS